jgi:acetyl esterase/lipase
VQTTGSLEIPKGYTESLIGGLLVLRHALKFGALTAAILFLCVSSHAEDFKDVLYADIAGVALTLDAHIPDGAGPFPAAVLVHGGGWIAGDKRQYITYLFQPLTEAGFAWFSINYRLAPQHKFPAAAEDVQRAIEYVKQNAAKYKVNDRRIALIGESAGGHLVSYVGARNREKSRVGAVVSLYGIHDFVSASVAWKPVPSEVFQLFGVRAIDAEAAPILVKASPVAYVKRDMPPFLLIHGSKDEDVPHEQSVEMCEKMNAVGARCELITLEGAPHGMDHWEPHPEFLWYKKALVDWLKKTLK